MLQSMDIAASLLAERLQAQHLAADRAGRARCVRRRGNAESLLWAAPDRRILRRVFSDGAHATEVRVLIGDGGEALAWWQRSSGGSRRMPLPASLQALRHLTLITIDGPWHDLGVQPVIDELAALSGRDPGRPALAHRMPATAAPRAAAAMLSAALSVAAVPVSSPFLPLTLGA